MGRWMQTLTLMWAGVGAHKAGGGDLEGGPVAAGLCYCSSEGLPHSKSSKNIFNKASVCEG